jgi:hypothetical protein
MLSLLTGDDAKTYGIVCRENFLSPSECDSLVACFQRCTGLLVRAGPDVDPFWDNRFLWITSLPDSESQARDLMNATRYRVIDELLRRATALFRHHTAREVEQGPEHAAACR